jgi:hypothetical protein
MAVIWFSLLLAIVAVVAIVVVVVVVVVSTTTATPGLTAGIVGERGDDGVGIVDSQTTRVFHLLKLGHRPWFVHVRDRDVSQFGDPPTNVFPVLIVIATLLDNVETIDTSTGQSSRGAPILTHTHTHKEWDSQPNVWSVPEWIGVRKIKLGDQRILAVANARHIHVHKQTHTHKCYPNNTTHTNTHTTKRTTQLE